MVFDKQNLFSDAQSLVAGAGTVVSTNSIDTGAAGTIPVTNGSPIHDVGRGQAVEVVAQITTDVTSGGAATIQFQVITSANADLSSPTVLCETAAIAKATLVAGYRFRIGTIPPGVSSRYLGTQYVIGTAAVTAGAVTAGLVLNSQTQSI